MACHDCENPVPGCSGQWMYDRLPLQDCAKAANCDIALVKEWIRKGIFGRVGTRILPSTSEPVDPVVMDHDGRFWLVRWVYKKWTGNTYTGNYKRPGRDHMGGFDSRTRGRN